MTWVDEIGGPAYASIAEMVAALSCDYKRREELREERDNWEPSDPNDDPQYRDMPLAEQWAARFPDDAEELAALDAAAGDCEDHDEARRRIEDDPLSLRVFGELVSGEWEADRFELLLTTGGPAVRIVGELRDGWPHSAQLEVQDWGTPWTEYMGADADTLLTYCRCFYYGD